MELKFGYSEFKDSNPYRVLIIPYGIEIKQIRMQSNAL